MAAKTLNITQGQVMRLKRAFKWEGAKGMIHGNAGRIPGHSLLEETKAVGGSLFNDMYSDHNFTLFTQRINEDEGISISFSSVKRVLKREGLKSKKGHKRSRCSVTSRAPESRPRG